MEKIKTIKTAISPEEEKPIQVRVDDAAHYNELKDGTIEITTRKAILFSIGR